MSERLPIRDAARAGPKVLQGAGPKVLHGASPKVLHGVVLESLFGSHSGPRLWPLLPTPEATLEALAALGLEFVQCGPAVRLRTDRARRHGLGCVASATWHLFPGDSDLERTIGTARDRGFDSASLLVGSNLTSDDQVFQRVEELLEVGFRYGVPIVLETHRATITESIPRTVEIVRRFPSLRLNLDLSHWFVTHRLDRIDATAFIDLVEPVLERVDLIHGRVAAVDEIQTPLRYARHREFFETVWAWVAERAGSPLRFAPELLPATMGYARKGDRTRWEDSLALLNAWNQR